MPLLVNKLIFSLVPDRAPFILRPVLRAVFKKLDSATIEPRLKIHGPFVSANHYWCTVAYANRPALDRLKTICQRAETGSQADRDPHLLTS